MSYIRMGQEGAYVDIPNGSSHYIYDNGETIEGWTPAQFAHLIGTVVDEIGWREHTTPRQPSSGFIATKFADHFGGWDDDYRGGLAPPERAEIFCQCVDRRIDGLRLTAELREAVLEWVDEFVEDVSVECDYCGTVFVHALYSTKHPLACDYASCQRRQEADLWGLTPDQRDCAEYIGRKRGSEAEWTYIEEHSTLDVLNES